MRRSILATLTLILFISLSVYADTIHVPADYGTIQAGIAAASDGDTVLVADGTYTGDGNTDIDFNGKAITLQSENGADSCIIDCEGTWSNQHWGFNFHSDETDTSVVDGFTIQNGYIAESSGGGICCYSSSSPTVTNCTITGNTSDYFGGGIFCKSSSSPTVTNCTITENTADWSGGGIYCEDNSSPTVTNCTITGNDGSGICCSSSSPTVTNCTITGNDDDGICCSSSSPTVTNCTITGNDGGGIFCHSSSLTVTNCTITGNTSEYGGGGICCYGSSPKIIMNCTITGNTADYGGGISCRHSSSSLTVTNCTITGNTANRGGGIYCSFSSPTVTNCTITGNTANSDGGGIFCHSSSPTVTNCTITGNTGDSGGGVCCSGQSTATLKNCILWNDSPQEIYFDDSDPNGITVSYSDVEGGEAGIDHSHPEDIINWDDSDINGDPLFVDSGGGDYRLQTESPCIDTGTADDAPSEDIEGNSRPYGDGVDMGAYEFIGETPDKPEIVVSPDALDLGEVIVGKQCKVTLEIGNDGDADLNVTNITHNLDGELEIDPSPPYDPPLTVVPDDSTTVTLTLTASAEGEINGTLTIESNDPTSPTEIDISAVAKILVGDLSGDGTVSAYDASLILQFVVGLITEFPIESMMVTSPSDIEPRDYEISIPDVSIKAGERIYVPVVVNDAKGLQAGGIVVKYDSTVLKAVDAMPTSTITGGSYVECNTELEGEIRFAFASMKPIEGGEKLLILEFSALQNIEGATSTLSLDHVKLSESLSIIKKNGSITVLPSQSLLLQNYPNPFNPETWIPFKLSDDAKVAVSIYDVSGQLVRKIGLGKTPAGVYVSKDKAVYWDGRNSSGEKVSSGLYFYTLQAGDYSTTKRMLILK